MSRPVFQDIIPPDKRSIQRIPVPSRRPEPKRREPVHISEEPAHMRYVRDEEMYRERDPEPIQSRPLKKVRRGRPRFVVWFIAFICIAAVAASFPYYFTGAKVLITPKIQIADLDDQLIAKKNPVQTELGYNVMTLSKDGSRSVAATKEEQATRKATGKIIVYNSYSKQPQVLIKSTRFESKEGLIFRTTEEITVPGKKDEGGQVFPGSVEVAVAASEPGDKYNIGLSDFTIPGFKGDPKYTGFFGRSKTSMTGGVDGLVKVADPEKVRLAREEIRNELQGVLKEEARRENPAGKVVFTDAGTFNYEPLPDSVQGNSVVLHERVTFVAPLFDEKMLSRKIAEKHIGPNVGDVIVTSFGDLVMTPTKPADISNNADVISFKLKGKAKIVSQFSHDKLKADLLGKNKKDALVVLRNYSGIERADIVIRPFWKRTVPKNIEKLTIDAPAETNLK